MATSGNAISNDSSGKVSTTKDPQAQLDYSFDWSEWLAEIGDTISSHQTFVEQPAGATTPLNVVASTASSGIVTIFINGGTVGMTHVLTCRITTTNGTPRIDERSLNVNIRDR